MLTIVTSYIYPHLQIGEVLSYERFTQESLFVTALIFFKGTIQFINAGALFYKLNSAYFISFFFYMLL